MTPGSAGARLPIETPTPNITFDYYFSQAWQVLEVRKDADSDHLMQYVWGFHYVDALLIRFYDSDINGAGVVTQYITNDANMNVASLLSSAGAVDERYEYTPYGQVTVLDSGFATRGSSNFEQNRLYTGQMRDVETGLYMCRARYLNSSLGRFMTRESAGYIDGLNMYEYAVSDPIKNRDPTGHAVDCEVIRSGGKPCIDGTDKEICDRIKKKIADTYKDAKDIKKKICKRAGKNGGRKCLHARQV